MRTRVTLPTRALIQIMGLAGAVFFCACGGKPVLERATNNEHGGVIDGANGGGTDGGGTDGGEECDGAQTDSFHITVAQTHNVNIALVIDDSGSMSDEAQKVVFNLTNFLDGIVESGSDYKLALVFDHTKQAFDGQTFYRTQADKDAHRNAIASANPFQDFLNANPTRMSYVQRETWSKWSDIAIFKAFSPVGYIQDLPATVPADEPPDGWGATVETVSSCSGPNKFFRPRSMQNDLMNNFYNTPGCIDMTGQARVNLASIMTKDVPMNFVVMSDDSLNVNWDLANFSISDSTKDAYPEISYNMLQQVTNTLKENADEVPFYYHSIVGFDRDDANVEEAGYEHLALSRKTGGASFNITQTDWAPLFAELQDRLGYAQGRVTLSCGLGVGTPSIRVTCGSVVNDLVPADYDIIDAKHIRLLSSAFDGCDDADVATVRVQY